MALTPGLQIPIGIQPVNPVPVDSWSGPYTGSLGNDNEAGAKAAANASIPSDIRFQSMEVRLIFGNVAYKYWYRNGIANADLILFSSEGSGGSSASYFNSETVGAIFTTGALAIRGSENIDSPRDKGSNVFFYVSGSLGGNDKSLFGGDISASGSLIVSGGISGSLTKLPDGTSYLVAGSGITISSASNGAITIASEATASFVFPNDILVSLTGGRTFGRYASGATIPATGKTPAEVILLAVAEPIDPTVSITGTNPITSTFGISGSINSSITGSYTINTLGGSVSAARLQFRSGSSGDYTILSTSTTSPLNFDHTFTVGAFFTTALNYQYIIADSGGAYATGSLTLTPQAYSAPSISLTATTTTPGSITGETNSKREKGNIGSTIIGTITRNRANAPLSSYSVQYQVNGSGAWVDVPGLSNISASGSSVSIPSTSHDDATLKTSTSLVYRVQVVDSYQTTTSSSTTISFLNVIFYAPVVNAPTTSANVRAIANKVFTDSANPFNLITNTVENDFAVALPTTSASNDTISSVIDLDALNADITANYILSTFNVDDAGGTAVSYNVYTLSNATPYATSHRHQITRA